jgi:hypothetical protein
MIRKTALAVLLTLALGGCSRDAVTFLYCMSVDHDVNRRCH